eukprot:CAMPEP_0181455136 /NCGR_PEP_ID=MMETSP1110-20121109/30601_1 /TAXON_ID=174948 /ORGANISM="Symbiodinium sp., Strain CCMP421" /LENGTH=79 /DNA_ID=CAMNT_0023579509 /DNA_START=227 /DNA_END=463 /DNA_ORIENTATION=+
MEPTEEMHRAASCCASARAALAQSSRAGSMPSSGMPGGTLTHLQACANSEASFTSGLGDKLSAFTSSKSAQKKGIPEGD